MQHAACSGHVLEITDLIKHIAPASKQTEFEKLLEEEVIDCEEIEQFLNQNLPIGFPPIESVFILSDEDESQYLKPHTLYAYYDGNYLFTRTATSGMKIMQSKGIAPIDSTWVTFG